MQYLSLGYLLWLSDNWLLKFSLIYFEKMAILSKYAVLQPSTNA